jgi:O-antigen/teichoic acid export membrane protein
VNFSRLGSLLAARILASIVSLLSIPIYLHLLGLQNIGLINFFAVVQSLVLIADFGFSPASTRVLSDLKHDQYTLHHKREFFHTLSNIQLIVSCVCCVLLLAFVPLYFRHFTHASTADFSKQLPPIVWLFAALSTSLALPLGLQTAALSALQDNRFLAHYLTISSLGRLFITAFVLLWFPILEAFFSAQVFCALVSLWVLRVRNASQLSRHSKLRIRMNWKLVQPHLAFAIFMSVIGAVGVVLSQADKLILSAFLPTELYAQYTLAASLAASMFVVIGAFYATYFSAFSALHAKGLIQTEGFILLRRTSVLLNTTLFVLAAMFVCFGEMILKTWLGASFVSRDAVLALAILSIGNAINGSVNIAYAMQLAVGHADKALRVNLIALLLGLPLMYGFAHEFGYLGVCVVWLLINVAFLLYWPLYVYRTILHRTVCSWYFSCVLIPATATFAIAALLSLVIPTDGDRAVNFAFILFGICICSVSTCLIIPEVRRTTLNYVKSIINSRYSS